MPDPNFFEQAYQVARLIPVGRVTSYGAIAAFLGTKGSARMVGWAMQAAGSAEPPVPAHRVVNSAGLLTGRFHFKPLGSMEQRLEEEGVMVNDGKIVDFKSLFWDPGKELDLER